MGGVRDNGEADGERSRKGVENLEESDPGESWRHKRTGGRGGICHGLEGHVRKEVTRSDLCFSKITLAG